MDLSRVEALLAQMLVSQRHGSSQAAKAAALQRAGFTNAEIAGMLGTTAAVVAQQLYELRSTTKSKSKKPALRKQARRKTPSRRR